MIIIIGRTGVGKSSLFEDITGPKGHAQQNTDSGKNLTSKYYEVDFL